MTAEDYELMPERKLSSMKKELETFKKHAEMLDPKTGLPKQTISSIENLNKSISSLLGLFKTATEELKLEERDEALISKQMNPLMKKIDILLEQNEKIAKAIVAIADMIREKTGAIEEKEEEIKAEEKKIEKEGPRSMPKEPMTQGPPAFPPYPSDIGPMPPPKSQFPPTPKGESMPPPGFSPPSAGGPHEQLPPLVGGPLPSGAPGPMPGFEDDLKPKKKGLFGGLFGKKL